MFTQLMSMKCHIEVLKMKFDHYLHVKYCLKSIKSREPEESFEILGQLRSARISWVHSDEDANSGLERDVLALEHESLLTRLDRVLNALDLYTNTQRMRIER